MHMIESRIFALTSILLPREMLFYEPEVLLNDWKFKVRINIERFLALNCHKKRLLRNGEKTDFQNYR